MPLKSTSSILKRKSASSSRKSQPEIARKSLGEQESQSSYPSSNVTVERKATNYEEELVLYLFYHLLDIIVEDHITIKTEENPIDSKEDEDEILNKNFWEIDREELRTSQIIFVEGSKILMSKKKRKESASKIKQNSANVLGVPAGTTIDLTSTMSEKQLAPLEEEKMSIENTPSEDWMIKADDESAIIKYRNGNIYEGPISRKVFHGKGKFVWANGTVYEGDFQNGTITGKGVFTFPDLSYYNGELCKGLMHGRGSLLISATPMIYSGYWKGGRKHGKGWLLYDSKRWYDGEWLQDKRHGYGYRQYKEGVRYKGFWYEGFRWGQGCLSYSDGDFYSGEWQEGLHHGYGEYIWKAFLNKSFSFPVENMYQGMWEKGKRSGAGTMHFGIDGGTRLIGLWSKNLKNGPGIIICGNGTVVEGFPLFVADKPTHMQMYSSMSLLKESLGGDSNPDFQGDEVGNTPFQILTQKLVKSKELRSISEFPKYHTQCNPIEIPLHATGESINVTFYIKRVAEEFKKSQKKLLDEYLENKEIQMSCSPSKWKVYGGVPNRTENTIQLYSDPIDEIKEEVFLRNMFATNCPKLRKLYNDYAALCVKEKPTYKLTLIRMFLWQFLRDIELTKNRSLIEIDKILMYNNNVGFEFCHNPFEKIYFWQFLHCLLELSWLEFKDYHKMVEYKPTGVVASIFETFLNEILNKLIPQKVNLFQYFDLLPIQSVYLLYRSIGEPHSARDFLKQSCIKKHTELPCYLKSFEWEMRRSSMQGSNIVPVGESVVFFPDKQIEYGILPEEPIIPQDDSFYKHLYIFRKLGAKKVMCCLATACPLIMQDATIVNMKYKLTFLEFYETLIFCAFTIVDDKKQKERRSKEVVEEIKKEIIVVEKEKKSKKTKKNT